MGRNSKSGILKHFDSTTSFKLAGVSTQSTFYPTCTGGLFPGGAAARHEADHIPTISAEVMKTWISTSTALYAIT
jgi:hypothetical protein